MTTRHLGTVWFGSLRPVLAGMRYGAEWLGYHPAPPLTGVPMRVPQHTELAAEHAWNGLMAWGRSLLGISSRRQRGPSALYLEYLEQRQLLSAFQIAGSRDATDAHLYHLALSTDSPTIESWKLQWADGSTTQTVAGDAQTVDHTFADLADPIITAAAVDGEGVHVVALVPDSTLGTPAPAPGMYSLRFITTSNGVVHLRGSDTLDGRLISAVWAWTQTQVGDLAATGDGNVLVQAMVAAQGDTELLLTPETQGEQTPPGTGSTSRSRGGNSSVSSGLDEYSLNSENAAGHVVRETWEAEGDDAWDISTYDSHPSGAPDATDDLYSLGFVDCPPGYDGMNRVQGFITAPETGDYQFWLATGDSGSGTDTSAALFLSGNADPSGALLIAAANGETVSSYDQHGAIHLEEGQTYYFEMLQTELAGGGYHYTDVGWADDVNGGYYSVTQQVISGDYLTAYAAAPAGFSATADGSSQIDLRWSGDCPGDGYYLLKRSGPSGLESQTAIYPGDGHDDGNGNYTFTDTGLVSGEEYLYTLQVAQSGVPISGVATASATTDAIPPTLSIWGANTVPEGGVYVLNLASSGPGADVISSWTIDWKDGNVQTIVGNLARVSHRYLDGPSTHAITASATDEYGTFLAPNTVPVSVIDTGTRIWPYYPSAMTSAGLKLNGSSTLIDGALRLTSGSAGQSASAYGLQRFDVTSFSTDFTFQVNNARAGDGLAFIIENQDPATETPTARSTIDGGMGFSDLTHTLALAFDSTNSAVGLYADSTPGGGDWHTFTESLDLLGGDPLSAHLAYQSGTLTLNLTDALDASKTFTTSWEVSIPSTVGDDVGYMGFTAAGDSAIQDILSWTYQPLQHSDRLMVASQGTSVVSESMSLKLSTLNVSASNARDGTDVTYQWLVADNAPGLVAFDDNNSPMANQAVATFASSGTYTLYAKLTDSTGASVLSNPMTVTLTPVLTFVVAGSGDDSPTVVGDDQQFTAVAYDQFGDRLATQPTFTWSETGAGYGIDATTGVLTLGNLTGGSQGYQVVASADEGAIVSSPVYYSQTPSVAHLEASLDESMTVACLSAQGTDVGGGSDLTYSWTLDSGNAAAVNLWDAASADALAYFTSAGTYRFRATVSHDGQSDSATVTVNVPQILTALYVTPSDGVPAAANGTQHFTALAVDQFGHALAIQPTFTWNLSGDGFTLANGTLTAQGAEGHYQVSVSAQGRSSNVLSFSQLLTSPTLTATIDSVTNTSVALSVTAPIESDLTYTWSLLGPAPADVSFSDNGDHAAKDSTVTFYSTGTYRFLVTIANSAGETTSAVVSVPVDSVLTTLTAATTGVAPTHVNDTQLFTANAYDQFGQPMALPSLLTWSVSNSGYAIDHGTLTATVTPVNPYDVKVSSDFVTSTLLYFSPTPYVAIEPHHTLDDTGTAALLSVLGADVHGGTDLRYAWTVTSTNAANVSFSDYDDLTAATTTAYFSEAGDYIFQVTIFQGTTPLSPAPSSIAFTVPQVLTSILAQPASTGDANIRFDLEEEGTQHFTAMAYDQFGQPMIPQPASYDWDVVGNGNAYAIDNTGELTTRAIDGSYIVTARASAGTGTVISEPLEFSQGVSVSLGGASATLDEEETTADLNVSGSIIGDPAGPLTYTWTTTDNSPGGVTFSSNGDGLSASPTVTFSVAGTYTFLVTMTDADGDSSTSVSNSLTVYPHTNSVQVTPLTPLTGGTQQFAATAYDQFGNPMASQPAFTWDVDGANYSIVDGTLTFSGSPSPAYTVYATAVDTGKTGSLTLTRTFGLTTASMIADSSGVFATLGAVANDSLGGADLTYTWSVVGGNPDNVWFADNGDASAATTQAYFGVAGTYQFLVTISDSAGNTLASLSTADVTIQSVLTSIDVSTLDPVPLGGGHQQFTAVAYNQFGQRLGTQPEFDWDVSGDGYEIAQDGSLTLASGASPSSYTVTAAADGLDNNGNTIPIISTVPQNALAPVFTDGITQTPSADGISVTLTAPAADMSGTADLSNSWYASDGDPGFVDFSYDLATPANVTATFYAAGTYHLFVTVSNSAGLSVTSGAVDVIVQQEATSIHFTSDNPPITADENQDFTVEVDDQFGLPMETSPSIDWTLAGVHNDIIRDGLTAHITAGSVPGTFTLTAACEAIDGRSSALATLAIMATAGTPTLVGQSLTVKEYVDGPSHVNFNILDGATNIDIKPYSIGVTTQPAHGVVTITSNDGTAYYTPDFLNTESDFFQVQVINHDGSCALETVTVDITPPENSSSSQSMNQPPSFVSSNNSQVQMNFEGVDLTLYIWYNEPTTVVTHSISGSTLNLSTYSNPTHEPINVQVYSNAIAWTVDWSNATANDTLELDTGACYTPDLTFPGNLDLTVGGVSGTIHAGNINGTVHGNVTSTGSITADGYISSLGIDGDLAGSVTAGGNVYNITVNGQMGGVVHADGFLYAFNYNWTGASPHVCGGITGTLYSKYGSVDAYSQSEISADIYAGYGQLNVNAPAGSVSGTVIAAQGDINVTAGKTITGTITAQDGDVWMSAGEDIDADISAYSRDAGGTLTGYISSIQSATGTIAGTIHAAHGIGYGTSDPGHNIRAGLDVTAAISSDTGDVAVHAGRDMTGTISAGGGDPFGDWLYLDAGRDITATVNADGIDDVDAGHDISGTITAARQIYQVIAGHAISGTITAGTAYTPSSEEAMANGYIGPILAGSWGFGIPYTPTAAGLIDSLTISASGYISQIAAVAALGYEGRIDGTTIISGGDIGSPADPDPQHNIPATGLSAASGINATVSAHGSIWALNPGTGDLAGSFTAITGSLPDITCQGSIAAALTAHTTIGNLTASQSISGTILATGNIGTVTALIGDISGNITSKSGGIADVFASKGSISGSLTASVGSIGTIIAAKDISGSIQAHKDIGAVLANGVVSGDIIAQSGSIGFISAGEISSTTHITAGSDALAVRCFANMAARISGTSDVTLVASGDVSGSIMTGLGAVVIRARGDVTGGPIYSLGSIDIQVNGKIVLPGVNSTFGSVSLVAQGLNSSNATAGASSVVIGTTVSGSFINGLPVQSFSKLLSPSSDDLWLGLARFSNIAVESQAKRSLDFAGQTAARVMDSLGQHFTADYLDLEHQVHEAHKRLGEASIALTQAIQREQSSVPTAGDLGHAAMLQELMTFQRAVNLTDRSLSKLMSQLVNTRGMLADQGTAREQQDIADIVLFLEMVPLGKSLNDFQEGHIGAGVAWAAFDIATFAVPVAKGVVGAGRGASTAARLTGAAALRSRVLANIAESQAARASSNIGVLFEKEAALLRKLESLSGPAHNAANYEKLKDWYILQEKVAQTATKDSYLYRPYTRVSVGMEVEANAKSAPNGLFLDANDSRITVGRNYQLGHKYAYEYRRLELYARLKGMTQAEFNNFVNNSRFYQIESPAGNMTHAFEKPGLDIEDLIKEFGW